MKKPSLGKGHSNDKSLPSEGYWILKTVQDMVVVVRDRGPIGIILLVISLLSLISLVVIILLIMQGRGNVMVVAIPAFPPEAILIGLVVGAFVVVARRFGRKQT